MPDFLDKCEEYFDTRDFYEVLEINRDATEKEIKKAYHKISLLVHPDRVPENGKLEATEKFKVLGKIHAVLQDPDKRRVYDETGSFDEDDCDDSNFNWMNYWSSIFKPITKKDIENYEKEYLGSDKELRDIKKAYVINKGNMDMILEMVPFSNCESEPRIMEIVREMVNNGEVEEYDIFFNEPKRKRDRRRKKWDEEKRECESMNVDEDELEKSILANRERQAQDFSDMLKGLEDKYGPKKRKSIEGAKPKKRKRSTRK